MENVIWPFFIEALLKKIISYFAYSTFVGAVFRSSLVVQLGLQPDASHQLTYCFHRQFNALVAQCSPHWTIAIRALAFVVVNVFDKLFYFGVLILLSDSFKVVVISLTIEIKSFKQLF